MDEENLSNKFATLPYLSLGRVPGVLCNVYGRVVSNIQALAERIHVDVRVLET